MGFGNNTQSIYTSIMDGKIVRRHKEPNANTKTRQNKNGVTVHEEFHDHFSGFIKDITIKEHDIAGQPQKFLNIHMVDGELSVVIQTQLKGGYATAFFKLLPNVDFSKRTTIIPKMTMDGDKKSVTIFINQGKDALKHYHTRLTPNGMPDAKEVEFGGKKQWDYYPQLAFFLKELEEKHLPRLRKSAESLTETSRAEPADATVKSDGINSPEMEDDLPF